MVKALRNVCSHSVLHKWIYFNAQLLYFVQTEQRYIKCKIFIYNKTGKPTLMIAFQFVPVVKPRGRPHSKDQFKPASVLIKRKKVPHLVQQQPELIRFICKF